MERRDILVNEKVMTLTTLSKEGFSVGKRPWKNAYDRNHFIIKTVHTIFDKDLFSFPHTPILIDSVSNKNKFGTKNNLRVLDMPIKFPASNDNRIPSELSQFEEVIAKIFSFETSINPNIYNYYAYLTVDQGYVEKSAFQRNLGCHVDGMQGVNCRTKTPINRSYIVYDTIPTVFYPQSFDTSYLDEKKDNFFLAFDDQADENAAITFDPYGILLMNAYTVHRAAAASELTHRTFLRLSFDTKKFDRYGNTHNPMFNYSWPMIVRHTQSSLIHKPMPHDV